MKLVKDDILYYFEYLDHGRTYESPRAIHDNPLVLWSVGKIVNEDSDGLYFAIISCGARNRNYKPEYYEFIVKSCIIKKVPVYQVKD